MPEPPRPGLRLSILSLSSSYLIPRCGKADYLRPSQTRAFLVMRAPIQSWRHYEHQDFSRSSGGYFFCRAPQPKIQKKKKIREGRAVKKRRGRKRWGKEREKGVGGRGGGRGADAA